MYLSETMNSSRSPMSAWKRPCNHQIITREIMHNSERLLHITVTDEATAYDMTDETAVHNCDRQSYCS